MILRLAQLREQVDYLIDFSTKKKLFQNYIDSVGSFVAR